MSQAGIRNQGARYCFYCPKPGVVKAKRITTGEIVYLCSEHSHKQREIESGRNAGAGAGIG